jgi:hypothetical protein
MKEYKHVMTTVTPTQQAAPKLFVEEALADSTESEVRFHLRQALQLITE